MSVGSEHGSKNLHYSSQEKEHKTDDDPPVILSPFLGDIYHYCYDNIYDRYNYGNKSKIISIRK